MSRQEIRLVGGRALRLRVRRSKRARKLRIGVSPRRGVVVVMPYWATRRDVDEMLVEAEQWLADRADEHDVWNGPRVREWVTGSTLPLLGDLLTLRLQPLPDGRTRNKVERRGDVLELSLAPMSLLDPRPALERWLRRVAGDVLRTRTRVWAERTGLEPLRVIVGERTSRWGSCSCRGTLSFCYRLVMAPADVVDAVVVHELCHLRHGNHGPHFKELVRSYLPDHDRLLAWLRSHGDTLEL